MEPPMERTSVLQQQIKPILQWKIWSLTQGNTKKIFPRNILVMLKVTLGIPCIQKLLQLIISQLLTKLLQNQFQLDPTWIGLGKVACCLLLVLLPNAYC